ncbi:PAS domain S-box protein [Archangium violaceum]|uniref:ATP-binding protein n=1 Tax=Archangium violaceum TaxID=83451 RepID=UPI00194F749B|nr:ATP-binding protein [Archangium violaceum]QRN93046.1 PAS domain S-box protein [Archangium violaceum]
MSPIHQERARSHPQSLRPPTDRHEASARRSLSLALVLATVVGVVLTLGLLRFEQMARQGHEREALVQQAARASKLASELESQLHASKQLVDTLASLAGPLREQRELEELLRRVLASAPERTAYGLGVWFEPGQFKPGVRLMGPYIHRNEDERGGPPVLTYEWSHPAYDYPRRPWYEQARRLPGDIVISEPYLEVDQRTYESLTRAFFDDQGRLRGVVSVDIRLPQVQEVVRQANVSDAESFYVVSRAGVLIAHPQEGSLFAWAREHGSPIRSISELSLENLRAWEHEHGLDRGRHTIHVPVSNAGWQVFASTREATLFSAVRHQRWLVGALGVVLWAGLGASGVAMARSERTRVLARTLTERQQREEERRRLLAQVRQRSAELQAIIENMVEAVIVADADGNITLANRAALVLFGTSSYEGDRVDTGYQALYPIHSLDGQLIPYDDLPLPRALRGEQVDDTDLLFSPPQRNRQLAVRLNAAPIRNESGQVVAAVSVWRDITQAVELERLQGDFVRMAAHEMKTPLAVMKSFAQLASRTEKPTPSLRRALEGINRGVNRMDRVIRTLLDASQLHLGQMHFEKEVVELRELMEAAAARIATLHPGNPVHVRPGPEARVLGDRARLAQVLTELLDNAARYSPEGYPVEVALTPDGDEVELSIHDEGIGIPEDRRQRVFDRFYRAHAGTPHDRGGMGLGLYLSRGIVLHHGGRMELESREGEGTRVRVRLPRLAEQHPTPERATFGMELH